MPLTLDSPPLQSTKTAHPSYGGAEARESGGGAEASQRSRFSAGKQGGRRHLVPGALLAGSQSSQGPSPFMSLPCWLCLFSDCSGKVATPNVGPAAWGDSSVTIRLPREALPKVIGAG